MLFLASLEASAQFGFRVYQFRPTGDLGYGLNRAVGVELGYMDDFEDESYRLRFGISYIKHSTRLDTMPGVGVKHAGGTTTVHPGYLVIHKYNRMTMAFGADYAFINTDKLALYGGGDVMASAIDMVYDAVTIGISERSITDTYGAIGFRYRLGFEYHLSESIIPFMEMSRSHYRLYRISDYSHTEISLGSRFIF